MPQLRDQDRDELRVAADARANLGGGAGLSAHDQDGAQALLEELYALRDSGGGDVQHASRALETAFARDCGDGREQCLIEHVHLLKPLSQATSTLALLQTAGEASSVEYSAAQKTLPRMTRLGPG